MDIDSLESELQDDGPSSAQQPTSMSRFLISYPDSNSYLCQSFPQSLPRNSLGKTPSPDELCILTDTPETDERQHALGVPEIQRMTDFSELEKYLQDYAGENGYALVALNTSWDKTEKEVEKHFLRGAHLVCVEGGEIRDNHKEIELAGRLSKKIHSSNKNKCPFRLKINTKKGKDGSPRTWSFSVDVAYHNHAARPRFVYHQQRKLTDEQLRFVLAQLRSGIKPTPICIALREMWPGIHIRYKDVQNVKQMDNVLDRNGFTATEAALQGLSKLGLAYKYWTDDEGKLLGMVIVNPMSAALALRYGQVLAMDCTYKTNRYQTPLFHIVGAAPTGQCFSAAIGWIAQEDERFYTKILQLFRKLCPNLPTSVIITDSDRGLRNALARIWPTATVLLCQYHARANFVPARGLDVPADRFEQARKLYNIMLTKQTTEEEFLDHLVVTQMDLESDPATSHLWDYIVKNKVPERQQLCAPWVNEVKHYGGNSSNRSERANSGMKSQLATSNQDLYGILRVCLHYIHRNHIDILQQMEIELMRRKQLPAKIFRLVS